MISVRTTIAECMSFGINNYPVEWTQMESGNSVSNLKSTLRYGFPLFTLA